MSDDSKAGYVVGVDLGGTKILAGIFDEKMKLLGRSKMSTKAHRGESSVIERIARAAADVVDECDLSLKNVAAVGVGAPGAVDSESGKVLFAPNLGWKDVGLQKALEKSLGLPVAVANDCNASALGVYAVELTDKPRHMIGLFLGTGIGAGMVIDGKLHTGFNRTAGEVGHMVIDVGGAKCVCGNQGCFETLAGRQALFKKIQLAVKGGQKTVLTEMLGPDLDDLRSGDLRKAIRRGDKFVEDVVKKAAEATGVAVANLITLLSPEVVVLGGGLIDALESEMMPVIIETAKKRSFAGSEKNVKIIPSKLGDDAGITGAAVLAWETARKSAK